SGDNDVIGVGSTDSSGNKSTFSQYNSLVDVVAPGNIEVGLYKNSTNSYVSMYGTSMATPLVAAVAALAKEKYKAITAGGFFSAIKKSSEDKGDAGRDNYYGYGLINASKLITVLTDEGIFEDLTAADTSDTLEEEISTISNPTVPKKKTPAVITMPEINKPVFKKISAGKSKIIIFWERTKNITKYQLQYRIKGIAKWRVKTISSKKTSYILKKLKKGMRYQFRIRAYRVDSGKKYYSSWSKIKLSRKVK
ncbi:MAG: S8 family serine peptidase, partial [Clostridiales Family XIII bacterium]|nr:S8 family serine peptidase [Clostridiales Family XIII bacterium]